MKNVNLESHFKKAQNNPYILPLENPKFGNNWSTNMITYGLKKNGVVVKITDTICTSSFGQNSNSYSEFYVLVPVLHLKYAGISFSLLSKYLDFIKDTFDIKFRLYKTKYTKESLNKKFKGALYNHGNRLDEGVYLVSIPTSQFKVSCRKTYTFILTLIRYAVNRNYFHLVHMWKNISDFYNKAKTSPLALAKFNYTKNKNIVYQTWMMTQGLTLYTWDRYGGERIKAIPDCYHTIYNAVKDKKIKPIVEKTDIKKALKYVYTVEQLLFVNGEKRSEDNIKFYTAAKIELQEKISDIQTLRNPKIGYKDFINHNIMENVHKANI